MDDPTKDFANDPRVSFDKSKQNWVLEDDNGNELEWDSRSRRFITLVCHSILLGYSDDLTRSVLMK